MLHLCCQVPSVGLANKPNSLPSQQAWVMAGDWLPKPSLKDTLNQEGPVILIQSHLLQHHSLFITKICLHDQQTSQQWLNSGKCPDMVLAWHIRSEDGHHKDVKTEVWDGNSSGPSLPNHLHPLPLWNPDLRVIGPQYLLPHQCLHASMDLEVLGTHAVDDGPVRNPEAIWR